MGVRIFEDLGTIESRLLRLEVVVLLSAMVLAALVLYGSTRRRSSDRLLRGVMWMAYSLSYVVVTYAVGIIQDGPFHGETFVLWAAALLLIQASAYAAPVHSRRDVDQRKKLLLQHVLQTALVLWLVLNATGTNASYRAAIWAFWSLNVLKTAAKIVEMIKASLPDRSVKVVAEYMDVEESLAATAADQRPPDPGTMAGYKYLFHGEDTMELNHEFGRLSREEILVQSTCKSVVTIDQVYRWIDVQGYSDVEKDMAKDFCLAFALFKLLKRRFYGYVPAEAGSAKALSLVLDGLIHQQHPQSHHHNHHRDIATGPDAAFRVVEAELAFLYDFFYTRNIVLVGVRTYICIAVVVLALTMWTAFFGTLGPDYRRLRIGVKDLDRSVTVVVIVITAALEMCQALAAFSNNWRYIKTVYRCVRDGQPWQKKRRGGHLWWKESLAPPDARYWEDKIGEYVLLKRFAHRPLNLLSWLTLFLVEPRRQGQKREQRKECRRRSGAPCSSRSRRAGDTSPMASRHCGGTACFRGWRGRASSPRPPTRSWCGTSPPRAATGTGVAAAANAATTTAPTSTGWWRRSCPTTARTWCRSCRRCCRTRATTRSRSSTRWCGRRGATSPAARTRTTSSRGCTRSRPTSRSTWRAWRPAAARRRGPGAAPSWRRRRCWAGSSGRPWARTTGGGGRCWPSSGRSSCCSSRRRTTWTSTPRCSAPAASS
uniref:DUF4220 domain-containing protein n=1 Tax=Triticum urartu TaxID=4572 RepID=A0A8R7P7U4_TRIUA